MGADSGYVYRPPTSIIKGLGHFDIKVEKPYYIPGDLVKGKLYLTLEPNFSLSGILSIAVVGDEKVEF
jgi:hypothetical protein